MKHYQRQLNLRTKIHNYSRQSVPHHDEVVTIHVYTANDNHKNNNRLLYT